MNKKVLSALLFGALMVGTGTFTSCIDTDEPEGIENLRGAKAELIRAKVAVEAANAAYVQAQAQLTLSEAKINEAKARYEAAYAAEQEAKAELAAAQTAEQKALYEKQIAGYKIEMAEAAKAHEVEMLRLQGELAKQQQTYDEIVAAIETAKLTLTESEAELLGAAQQAVADAAEAVNSAYETLVTAQGDVNQKMTSKAQVTLAQLETELAYEQAELAVAEFEVVKAQRQLALAEDFDAEAWNAQIAELKGEKQALDDSLAIAKVDLQKVHVGDEFQAAEDAYELAVNTLGAKEFVAGKVNNDKDSYTKGAEGDPITTTGEETIGETEELTLASKKYLAADSLAKALEGTLEDEDGNKITAFKLAAFESEAIDESLMKFIEKNSELNGMISTVEGEKVFQYLEQPYTEKGYREDLEKLAANENYEAPNGALFATQTLEGWIEALSKFSTDKNGEAWAGIEVEKLKEALADTKAAYEADSTAWDIMLKAYKGTKTTAPTNLAKYIANDDTEKNADVDAAVKAYNEAFAAVGTAVTAYNTSIDALKTATEGVYKAAYDADIAKQKTEKANATYIIEVLDWLSSFDPSETWAHTTVSDFNSLPSTPVEKKTVANLEVLIDKNCPVAKAEEVKTKLATLSATAQLAATDYYQQDRLTGVGEDLLTYKADGTTEAKPNKINDHYEKMLADAANVAKLAEQADADKVIEKAREVITKATTGTEAVMADKVAKASDAYTALTKAMTNYQFMLAESYGQVLAGKNLTKIGTDEAGKLDYLNADGTIDWTTIGKDIVIDNTFIATTKVDNVDKVYATFEYKSLTASDITTAEAANLTLAALNEDDATIKLALEAKSKIAFGKLAWDAANHELRAIAPTREEAEKYDLSTEVGSFGELLAAEDNIALYEGMATAGESIEPIVEELTAQLEAVTAEIEANSAIIAAFEAKFDAAEAAYEAGEAAVEAALDARDAVCAEAEALVKAFEEKVSYVELLINTAQSQLDSLYPTTGTEAIDADQIVAYWKAEVAKAEKELAGAEDDVIAAEQAIEQFNAGVYTEEMEYKKAILKLEIATEAYETALSVYNQRLVELKAIIEALAK